jgi:hypothetical protein
VLLATVDAHGLYEQFGFEPLRRGERFMAIEPGGATVPSREGEGC